LYVWFALINVNIPDVTYRYDGRLSNGSKQEDKANQHSTAKVTSVKLMAVIGGGVRTIMAAFAILKTAASIIIPHCIAHSRCLLVSPNGFVTLTAAVF